MPDPIDPIKVDPVIAEAFALADYIPELKDNKPKELVASSIAMPVKTDTFTLKAHRVAFPDVKTNVIKCRAELSLDGGLTWSPNSDGRKDWPWGMFPIEFTASGGDAVGPDGIKSDHSSFTISNIPDVDNANRMIRTIFTPLETITTKVEVVFEKT